MIYSNLKGGLGNMLFQIAATISIATDNNQPYSFPNLYAQLNYLNLEINYNPSLNHSNEYLSLFKNFSVEYSNNNIKVLSFPFEYVTPPKINGDTILDGFFQSEKYFSHNRSAVLDFLDFTSLNTNPEVERLLSKDKRYTSLHVRRGDYVSLVTFYHQLSDEYYDSAIELLKDKTDEFLIFSDDIEWCKERFKNIKNARFIDNQKDYVELYMMSLCDNNIIANSSFSWWGAWLNNNENKIVVGPSIWFGSSISHSSGDVIPEKWIKI